jgi:hypothetical protein
MMGLEKKFKKIDEGKPIEEKKSHSKLLQVL